MRICNFPLDDTASVVLFRLSAAASVGKKKEPQCTILQGLSGITILLHSFNKTPVWKRIRKEQNLKNGKCYRRFSHCS